MRGCLAVFVTGLALAAAPVAAADVDWSSVDTALGVKAAVTADVHRYGFPRGDLSVTVDGVALKPALALGGWVAFKPVDDAAVAMGDLVLLESEVNPVISKLMAEGFKVTAVHNHLLRASPMVVYAHIHGRGAPLALAEGLRRALAASKTPLPSPVAAAPAAVDLDTKRLDEIIGAKGHATGGVYQFSIARQEQIAGPEGNLSPAGPMGVATGVNFQPTGGGKAAITGDFVLTAEEVAPVMGELQLSGIEITALHSHMLEENPRLFFMHFWANDDAVILAKGLRAALDKTARARS